MGISTGLLLFCLAAYMTNMASAEDQALSAAANSLNKFTLDFYLATSDQNGAGKNVLVSPLSAVLATALVHAGAKGQTAAEIEDALYLPKEKAALEDGFKALHNALDNTQNVTLEVANKVYVEKSRTLQPEYTETLSKVHRSVIAQADFVNNAEKERITINSWVSNTTHDKIKDLLPPGVLDTDTRLVLVNAVYFFGKWKEQFQKSATKDEDFYVSPSKTVKVPMMHLSKQLRYAEIPELDAKAVELAYTNENVRMQIILPNSKDGLQQLHEKLREKAFDLANINFYSTKVNLAMPRFKIEDTINLADIYNKLNITTMFTTDADLSGMIVEKEGLMVSKAIQKTFIDVNEEGTEAAAATGFTLVALSAAPLSRPKDFRVERPFMIRLIAKGPQGPGGRGSPRHSVHSVPLFIGSISKP